MAKQLMTTNEMLAAGIGILIIGIALAVYSVSAYSEMKRLETQFDFETLDKNNQISTSDKYYKYLEYSDILNQKLKENKNIPFKNVSCAYLDYAQHNALALYSLTDRKITADASKKAAGIGNIRALYELLDSYKNCSQAAAYKTELGNILEGADNAEKEKLRSDERLNEFLYGSDVKVPDVGAAPLGAENVQGSQPAEGEDVPANQSAGQNSGNTAAEPNYIDSTGHAQVLTPEQIEYINKKQSQNMPKQE